MKNPAALLSTRRALLVQLGCTAGFALLPSHRTGAADLPKLAVQDPAALALGYVEDHAQVDKKKYPGYVEGTNCENCLQLQGTAGAPYRPCSLFPGKLVATAGWCNGWTAEM